jgi:hypothetical protein
MRPELLAVTVLGWCAIDAIAALVRLHRNEYPYESDSAPGTDVWRLITCAGLATAALSMLVQP